MIRSGDLIHTAVFKRLSGTVDGAGQPVQTGTDLATVRCSVEPLNGKEYFEASGENSTVDTRVMCCWQSALADLTPADWLEVSGQRYDIQSVINPRMQNRELVIMCKVHSSE